MEAPGGREIPAHESEPAGIYSRIFAGSEPGVIYAQKPNGELYWYRDELCDGSNNPNGSSGWDPKSGRHIGSGWKQFVHVCAGLNG